MIFITGPGSIQVYKVIMRFGRLISSGLLLAVLMAPALGMAMCAASSSPAKSACAAHCAMMAHAKGDGVVAPHQAPAPAKAPCCERKTSAPAATETVAQIVAQVQIALLRNDASCALVSMVQVRPVEIVATPPQLASPLSLLCTLLI